MQDAVTTDLYRNGVKVRTDTEAALVTIAEP
jgi:hypothetical protein